MNRPPSSQQGPSLEVRTLMEECLDVLRTYRHDLMNQVQLIQAYAQMKKYDRLQTPIRSLVEEAQRHTAWSSFPSAMISYVVLSRDISYLMLNMDVTYEQIAAPTPECEERAALLLADLLDQLGEQSKTVLEPITLDVWIVSFGQGYEIGWSLSQEDLAKIAKIDWQAWQHRWEPLGVVFTQDKTENGVECQVRFQLQE